MDEEEITVGLKLSSKRVGRLYPVILDAHGNIIDGLHRLEADPKWPKIRLSHIASDKDRLVARLIANVCRRRVSAEEKSKMLEELGELYVKAGVKPGAEIARKISEETGMSFRWVMKYLPDKFKERPGVGGPPKRFTLTKVEENISECKVAHRATLQIEVLLSEPVERVLTVKKYANVNFVQVMLEKRFYANVERIAENLGTTPDVIINNVLVLAIRKLMDVSNSNKLLSIIQ
jgi:predicted DNA-binding ribbon-helix-helix protein